ncbi:MAG: RnfABCDGE type electron transport complex subunit D [Clostridia bacterium]|nr:RnfABCDGE type electron transport complex subunit D [Clostridia bacterium]
MQNRYAGAPSPHLRNDASTRRIMSDVCIALLPAALAAMWFFGLRAGALMAVAVASAVIAEWLYNRLARKPNTTGDWSAVVTGMLLAFNLPAYAPWWLAMAGSVIAIVLIKQFFGGLGQNFMNPALAARVILVVSWGSLMTHWAMPDGGNWLAGWGGEAVDALSSATVDAHSGATPLTAMRTGSAHYGLWDLFIGNVPGILGETSTLALLIGAGYLLLRGVISWRIPVCFIGVFFALTLVRTGALYSPEPGVDSALYQLLSGSLILGAFFMATDYSSVPVTPLGQMVYGAGCGILLFLFRSYHATMTEGCAFAILLMNVASPLIERVTLPRAFGEVKRNA